DVVSTEMVVHELMVAIATDDDTAGMTDEITGYLDGARVKIEGIDAPALAGTRAEFLDSWAAYDEAIRDDVLPLLAKSDVKGAGKAMFDGSDAHFDEATAAVQKLTHESSQIAATERAHAEDVHRSTI
ncbi:hypothetical protein ACUDAB_26470, partial [Escherichia coli]|uniref:hypothetical protein n=1 Tax=Escherichia coli TaxID=562 RepID=UPI00403CCC07